MIELRNKEVIARLGESDLILDPPPYSSIIEWQSAIAKCNRRISLIGNAMIATSNTVDLVSLGRQFRLTAQFMRNIAVKARPTV